MIFNRCKHNWITAVPRVGKCYRQCTICGKKKKAGCNG